jgi:hypothetical protein
MISDKRGGAAVNKIRVVVLFFAVFVIAGYAQGETIWFSPLTAIPEDEWGGYSQVLSVNPTFDAVVVTASKPVSEIESKGIVLGLTTQANKVLKGVEVCYVVGTDSPGSTYISEIKVEMMTPDELTMIYGDKPNLNSITTTCYTSKAHVKPKPKIRGTTTLSLKMVFGKASDRIFINGIGLIF